MAACVVFVLSLATTSANAFSRTLASAAAHAEWIEPARCYDRDADIQKIKAIQIQNKKSSNKYDGYRSLLKNEDPATIMARLVYAEVVAAECAALQDEILPGIAEVIANRVRKRRGLALAVIFERDQFASSLNMYNGSRFRDFLCPRDGDLWAKSLKKSRMALRSDPRFLPSNAYNYYFYRHEPKFKVPAWADRAKSNPVRTHNFELIDTCVRFFNHLPY